MLFLLLLGQQLDWELSVRNNLAADVVWGSKAFQEVAFQELRLFHDLVVLDEEVQLLLLLIVPAILLLLARTAKHALNIDLFRLEVCIDLLRDICVYDLPIVAVSLCGLIV